MATELKWVITEDFGGEANVALCVKLEGWDYTAYIKWDGCCEIRRMKDSVDRDGKLLDSVFHICDVPQFIKVLQSLEDFRMNNIEGAE